MCSCARNSPWSHMQWHIDQKDYVYCKSHKPLLCYFPQMTIQIQTVLFSPETEVQKLEKLVCIKKHIPVVFYLKDMWTRISVRERTEGQGSPFNSGKPRQSKPKDTRDVSKSVLRGIPSPLE